MSESEPPRVVHVVWSLDDLTGGLVRAVVLIANAHAHAGMAVTIAATTGNNDVYTAIEEEADASIQIRLFPRSPLSRRVANSRSLRRWLTSTLAEGDTVHVHAVWDAPAMTALAVGRLKRCRVVATPHGSLEPFDLRKHARVKRLLGPLVLRPLLKRVVVHCTTQREAEVLTSYGADPAVTVLPLPLGDAVGPTRTPEVVRQRYGTAPTTPVLLFLGRVDYKKGIPHLLEAMSLMATPGELWIAGRGEPAYEDQMRRLAHDLGLTSRVRWLGWLDSAARADVLSAADLFVLLSDAENYGIAVVEALQQGCVVATSAEVGSAADLAAEGAVLICSRESTEAARSLDRFLNDHVLRAATKSSWQRVASGRLRPDRLVRGYRDLAVGTVRAPRR